MRLLVLSDIHGNLEALEACLKAAPEFDRVANLGDVVGYGASPNQVIERIRQMDAVSVRGNHDRCCCWLEDTSNFNPVAAAAVEWTRRELSDANIQWLRSLPSGPLREQTLGGVQLVHGSPLEEDDYITSSATASEAMEAAQDHLTFFGHTHIQCAYAKSNEVTEMLAFEPMNGALKQQVSRLKLDPATSYLVNPGSIGQPRDRDRRAAFAIYDSERREVLFYRVPYDIARAQERILQAGLPPALAMRLDEGR